MKKIINCSLKIEKIYDLNVLLILKLLFNSLMIWIKYTKILKNAIEIRNPKY